MRAEHTAALSKRNGRQRKEQGEQGKGEKRAMLRRKAAQEEQAGRGLLVASNGRVEQVIKKEKEKGERYRTKRRRKGRTAIICTTRSRRSSPWRDSNTLQPIAIFRTFLTSVRCCIVTSTNPIHLFKNNGNNDAGDRERCSEEIEVEQESFPRTVDMDGKTL